MVALVSAFRPDSCVVAEVRPSPNHGERKLPGKPDMIVLHYTGMTDVDAAISKLCTPGTEVSAHYVVMEDGYIIQCVPEARRAWHAGEAVWEGESDINSCSIGIEIANPGHSHGYPDFTKRQIAPARKQDPGEKFPWRVLHDAGIGLWVKPAPIVPGGRVFMFGETDPAIAEIQRLLGKYGYDIPVSGNFDGPTREAITAFQRHFRPAKVDGVVDTSTIVTIKALVAAREAQSD
jgi:N-acetylmuramoyl-L-alanine amidase